MPDGINAGPPKGPQQAQDAQIRTVPVNWSELAETAFMLVYTFALVMVSIYGLHRYVLLGLYYRHRRKYPKLAGRFEQLPRVTIQLPMYNEKNVAKRIIQVICRIDYPRELLDIQVLDDSVDETQQIARAAVAHAREQGFDISYIHRDDRTGFKAGALGNGLKTAKGEFVTIFDADFVPEPSILKDSIHYFSDPTVAVVQTRWDHLNRDDSLLTKSQAILLDGHFIIEHIARSRSDRFMSFNGTAGTWRRSAISDAGGWRHDTLTEDLDLSYRAQMRGWKILYLPQLTAPAELPPEMAAFKAQQFRWTKGGAQTALKLMPRVFLSPLPLKVKIEAFFHLTAFSVHFYMALLVIMMFPALMMRNLPLESGTFWRTAFDMSVLLLATLSGSLFYVAGQAGLMRDWRTTLKFLPLLMALGVGMCASNTKALLEALVGRKSDFIRTPKYGDVDRHETGAESAAGKAKRKRQWLPYIEIGLGIYMIVCTIWSLINYEVALLSTPFLSLFAFGFFYVSLLSLQKHRVSAPAKAPEPSVAAAGVYVSQLAPEPIESAAVDS